MVWGKCMQTSRGLYWWELVPSSNLSLVFRCSYWSFFEPEDPFLCLEEKCTNSLESDGESGIEMFWEREPMYKSSDEPFRTRLQCRTVSSWCCSKALNAAECSLRTTRPWKVFFQKVDKPKNVLQLLAEWWEAVASPTSKTSCSSLILRVCKEWIL